MTLNEALRQIAGFLGLDPQELIQYAAEDTIGGYHANPARSQFPCGSLWTGEGKALYAVTRALNPISVLELGAFKGASTNHLRSAVRMNGRGYVISVDVWEGAGELVSPDLNEYGRFVFNDGVEQLSMFPKDSIDLAFEDMLHDTEQVMRVCELLLRKLVPGGVCIHHDSEHPTAGIPVKTGVQEAGITDTLSLVFEDSDCGLLFWRRG
jgi:predicted O-methyltransferase YrrM